LETSYGNNKETEKGRR